MAVLHAPIFTPESVHEADALQRYCERFPIGERTAKHLSVTGESYIQKSGLGYPTAAAARIAAQEAFDEYAGRKSGILYWRIVPEIYFFPRKKDYGFYFRCLISNRKVLAT